MRKVKYNEHWFYSIDDVIKEQTGMQTAEVLMHLRERHNDIDWNALTIPLPMPDSKHVIDCIDENGVELLRKLTLSDFNDKLHRAINFTTKPPKSK